MKEISTVFLILIFEELTVYYTPHKYLKQQLMTFFSLNITLSYLTCIVIAKAKLSILKTIYFLVDRMRSELKDELSDYTMRVRV